jgi:hypothetical protein
MTNMTKTPAEILLSYFTYEHLPVDLRTVSQPFAELAHLLADTLPASAETTVALRKLLESKDCAVRAALALRNSDDA